MICTTRQGKRQCIEHPLWESDQKTGTKLKIRVSKEPIREPSPREYGRVDINSEKVGKFTEKVNDVFKKRSASSSPALEKLVLHKQDVREQSASGPEGSKDKDTSQLYRSALSAAGKSSQKAGGKSLVTASNNTFSKSDPKLAKATIRIKPINISSSSSSSITLTQPPKTLSSSRSVSDRSDRRGQSSSASTVVTTPTSSTMSLASILPNAPTASSVASLPPIPKRPKVSTVNASSSSTTTVASAKSTTPLANNSSKNSSFNSGYVNSFNKMSSNSSGIGGRSGNNPNTPNTHNKASSFGFNKTGTPAGILKTSANMPGHKPSKNTAMPQGILKNAGSANQGSTNSMKTTSSGNQGLQKSSSTANQMHNSSYRGPNSSNPAGGPQKTAMSGHGVSKNFSSQGGGVFKPSGLQSNLSRGQGGGNQNFQKGPVSAQGGARRSPNMVNQGDAAKASGSPGQGIGSQKSGSQGKGAAANQPNSMHRNLSHNSNLAQGSVDTVGQKSVTANSVGSNLGPKLSGNQARFVASGACNSSPGMASVRHNSVSSAGANQRAAPNHLPIGRSMSAPGQKGASGSNPRTPSGHSPSNPSAPRFPGQSSHQKSLGSSPSSGTPRSSSTHQTSSQRSSSSSLQSGHTSRSSSLSSQRPSTSPQTQRSTSSGSGSSPTQRPASTPGLAADTRPAATGVGQTPGYPVRPSSAGPRQGSSPLGQRLNSSPSGIRTSSPNGQGQRGSGSGTGVSPLASSHQSPTGGPSDVSPVSRQNSSGSLNSLVVSRQNSSVHLNSAAVSGQSCAGSVSRASVTRPGSLGSLDTSGVSRHNSSSSLTGSGLARQTSSSSAVSSSTPNSSSSVVSVSSASASQQSNTKTLSKQNSNNNIHSSAVFRQNTTITGGASVAASSRPLSNTGPKPILSNSVSRSASSMCVATSRQTTAPGGATSTSGKQLSSGSTTSSLSNAIVSVSRTSGAATSSAQRTSSGSSVTSGGGGPSVVIKPSLNGASGSKTSDGAVNKGANAGKNNATTTGNKTPGVGAGRLPHANPATSTAAVTATKTAASVSHSVSFPSTVSPVTAASKAHSSVSFTSIKSSAPSSSVPSSLTSSLSSLTASSVGSKNASGAMRCRKESLSAIVNKLATKVSASSGPALDNGESVGGGASVVNVPGMFAERRKSAMGEGEAIEQRLGVKRSSVSGSSPPSNELKVQRLDGHKSTASASSTPTTPMPTHTMTPHTPSSMSTPLSVSDKLRAGSTGENSIPHHSRVSTDIGLDLSMPKDKAQSEASAATPPPPQLDSKGRASPMELLPARPLSPGSDRVGPKFNGDIIRDRLLSENEVFKVPTPKSQLDEVEEPSGGKSSHSRPLPSSPLSDASSPDNDLIIDCGESSNRLVLSASYRSSAATTSVQLSAKQAAGLTSEAVAPGGMERTSPILGKASPSSNARGFRNSPQAQPSPHPKLAPSQSSPDAAAHEIRVNSPCEIDDDLMDAALMGFNAS